MATTHKMTVSEIRQIVREELADLTKSAKPRELKSPGEYADTVKDRINFQKALKVEESRLFNRLLVIREKLNAGCKPTTHK